MIDDFKLAGKGWQARIDTAQIASSGFRSKHQATARRSIKAPIESVLPRPRSRQQVHLYVINIDIFSCYYRKYA
ncbi:MAG: hypothetical protein H6842_11250 [Rhodospirillaceae bacterium]|nr:hypothetical protein [Rhodospirillaceae bacterium]